MWQPGSGSRITRTVNGLPLAFSPLTVSVSDSPNTLRPATQMVIEPIAAAPGHSTNFAKLNRYAAFTRYSSGTSCPHRAVEAMRTSVTAVTRIVSEPERRSDADAALELDAARNARAELG